MLDTSLLRPFTAKCLAVLAVVTCSHNVSASESSIVSADVRCFSAADDSVAMELRLYVDSEMWVGGQVLYRGMEDFIPLVFSHQEIEEEIPGRPWKYKDVWLEIYQGEVNGHYELYTQGVNIYNVIYQSRKSGERVSISEESRPENTWLDLDGVCAW